MNIAIQMGEFSRDWKNYSMYEILNEINRI